MAVILGTVTLGDSDATNNNAFVTIGGQPSRIWGGGATTGPTAVPFELSSDSDNPSFITARDATIICSSFLWDTAQLGRRNYGLLDFKNVNIDYFIPSVTFSGPIIRADTTFENVTFTTSRTAANLWGFYGADTNQSEPNVVVNWNNVNFFFDLDADNFSVNSRVFIGTITPDSVLNNINFWNGRTGADSKGMRPEFGSVTILNSLTCGPVVNNIGNQYSFFRYSNSGSTVNGQTATPANHWGCNANLDYRNISGFVDSDADLSFKVDNNSHIALINPLQGTPAAGTVNAFGWNNEFNSTSNDPRAHIFVATNPDFGEGEHRVALDDSDLNTAQSRGVYAPTQVAWQVATDFSTDSDVVFFNDSDDRNFIDYLGNGLYFREDEFRQQGSNGDHTVTAPLRNVTSKQYRVYSWSRNNWGTQVNVSVPPVNATDDQVVTARAGGYDVFNGRTWETSTEIANSPDTITSQTAIDTFAKANTVLLGLTDTRNTNTQTVIGGVSTSSYIPATSKAIRWAAMNIADNNAVFPLGYTITGTVVNYSCPIVFHDSEFSSWNDTDTTQTHTFSTSSLSQDSLITELRTTGRIALRGPNLNYDETSTKIILRSDDSIDLDSEIDTTTYRNFTFKTPAITGFRLVDTFDNLTLIADSDYSNYSVTINPGNTLNTTIDNVFGTNPDFQIHHDRPVTLNSITPLSIIIEDSDTYDLFTAGNNVTFLRRFITQPTRLRIDVDGIAVDSRINFYRGLNSDSELIASFIRTDVTEEIIISSDSEGGDVVFDSDIALSDEFKYITIGVSNRNYRTTFYPIEVQRNTATTDNEQVDWSFSLTGQTDESSNIVQTPVVGKQFIIRQSDVSDSEIAIINAWRTARGVATLTNNSQTVIEVNGCSIPNFGTTDEVSYMAASVRTDSEYLHAMRRKVGELDVPASGNFNAGVRSGGVTYFDIFQFVQDGVNVLPETRVLFSDTSDSEAAAYSGQEFGIGAIQGMYKTQNDSFLLFPLLNDSLDIGTLRQASSPYEPHVIAYPRAVATGDEVLIATANDLDRRLVTRRNFVNLGALSPVLDSDGSLAVAPFLP